ncbi:hypothetical protein [Mangrovibacterium marinum]|uniref:DoxX-like protein n=1 Tax=Mangrovibacterium marinum TaxID=1639118 RepID=A0A2T5C0I7_9BACT|nr:hypothetical protein [Mangrovibacterium marinum]PTN08080.1 hypothetical protein C8N47_111120 [Mangrovibacterium marinum]
MNTPKRPLLLNSALALSTIGSGVGSLAFFLAFIFYQQLLPQLVQFTNVGTPALLSRMYLLSLAVFALVSFVGVLQMWRFKRTGFYLYLAAQTCLWAFPLYHIGWQAFSSTNTIFSVLFLLIYVAFIRLFR